MSRNIWLAYLLTVCKYSWFWLGIWVFYYLRFTDYAGIGLIETVLIITYTLGEIPTGAVADLLGKRNTLIMGMFLEVVGSIWYAFANGLPDLLGSVFIMCLGSTFYSGTLEALVYDSMKQEGKETRYSKVISNLSSIALITPAIFSLVGGFMYTWNFRLPFIGNAMFNIVGLIITFFFLEPKTDTEKFNLTNYLNQTKQGLHQLFKSHIIRDQTILLLSIGGITLILDEMLNSFLGFEFGLSEQANGIVWGAIYIIAGLTTQLSPWIKNKLGEQPALILIGIIIAISLVISPFVGLVIGVSSFATRAIFQTMYTNLASIAINNHTESRYRATTLSTFNMLKNIPYVFVAYFFGSLSDTYSAKNTALILGIILFLLLLIQLIKSKPLSKKI